MANILSVCNNPRRRTRALNVNFNSTVAAAEQAQNINRISHLPVHPVPEEEEYRPLWDWYSTHNQFHLLSNFHEAYLEVLVEAMQPFIAEERRRGTHPCLGQNCLHLRCVGCLRRMRPILLKTLKARWWNNRIRPQPANGSFPFLALL
mmetsp:Transcript_10519/g.14400  ORF Transcript_10519/g.14400 Transcript_10519/m.14400 type:complete len:148 (+) Transcript_10519:208-651(+)